METIHRVKDNVLYHIRYTKEQSRFGWLWRKVYNSEEVCRCEDRGEQRIALREIKEEAK